VGGIAAGHGMPGRAHGKRCGPRRFLSRRTWWLACRAAARCSVPPRCLRLRPAAPSSGRTRNRTLTVIGYRNSCDRNRCETTRSSCCRAGTVRWRPRPLPRRVRRVSRSFAKPPSWRRTAFRSPHSGPTSGPPPPSATDNRTAAFGGRWWLRSGAWSPTTAASPVACCGPTAPPVLRSSVCRWTVGQVLRGSWTAMAAPMTVTASMTTPSGPCSSSPAHGVWSPRTATATAGAARTTSTMRRWRRLGTCAPAATWTLRVRCVRRCFGTTPRGRTPILCCG